MSERLYLLEQRDTSGVFLGLSAAECALLGTGFLVTIIARLIDLPTAVAAIPLVVAAGLVKVQVGGRALHQWVPLLASWAGRTGGRRRWHASLPLFPAGASGELPPALSGLDIIEISVGDGRVGVVRDRRAAAVTAILPVRPATYASTDDATQENLVDGWGAALAAFAASGSAVIQVGWTHQSTPSAASDLHRWLDDQASTSTELDDYRALVDEATTMAAQHETTVWITVSGRHIGGKGKLIDRAKANLPGALEAFERCLRDAGLQVGSPLHVPQIWRLLRRRADPAEATAGSGNIGLAARMGLTGASSGQPLAMRTSWSMIRIDGSCHRVYWIAAWPRRPVPTDWLSGLLLTDNITVSVLHRPLDPARSHRRVDSQLVKLSANRARKEEKGRRITEADTRTEQAAHDLEADLASGHGEVLYLGLVCVSAGSTDELEEHCHTVEQTARAVQLDLRVLHGRQDAAWAATLPMGLTSPSALELAGL